MRIFFIAILTICIAASAPAPSLPILTITKTPAEVLNVGVNFLAASNDGITLISVKAIKSPGGSDVSSAIISPSPAPFVSSSITVDGVTTSGTFVIFRVRGGTKGESVVLSTLVRDNVTGEIFQGDIMLKIATNF